MEKSCSDCYFEYEGWCHRFPPVVGSFYGSDEWGFPPVRVCKWCGEWKKKAEHIDPQKVSNDEIDRLYTQMMSENVAPANRHDFKLRSDTIRRVRMLRNGEVPEAHELDERRQVIDNLKRILSWNSI